MTLPSFRTRLISAMICCLTMVSLHAQQPSMEQLIRESLAKVSCSAPQTLLNCIAELKHINCIYPDSIQPKFQMALKSLTFCVMNPQAKETENLLAETQQTINQLKSMKQADLSDICTLQGFLYMDHIVQDPMVNGPRYYLQVADNFEQALQLNPHNQLAKELQQRFQEGMEAALSERQDRK